LEQVIDRAGQAWLHVETSPEDQYAYLDSVALNLHSFYSGLEKLFELIARHVDQNLPNSENWHRDLLQQMAEDLPSLRPAVISQESANIVDEFRRFRHLVRNVYTTELVPEKMAGLMELLPELWPGLSAELLAFADYLDALSASLSD
jgi:DNA-binding transcriptional regulator PaaX